MTPVALGDSVWLHFGTSSVTTGAATNADSTPTVTIAEDGADLAYAPTVSNVATGLYKVQIDATSGNGFEAGKRYSVYAVATVGGVTGRDGIGEFEVLTSALDVVSSRVDAAISSRMATFTLPANFSALVIDGAGVVDSDLRLWLGSAPNNLVSGRVDVSVGAMAADVLTAAATAADFGTEIGSAVWAAGVRTLTAGTNIVLAKGVGVTGFNDLDAAGVRGAVGLAAANLDTQLAAIAGFIDTEIAAILAAVDTEVAAIKAKTDNLPASPAASGDEMALTAAAIDAILDDPVDGANTVRQLLRGFAAALLAKASGLGTATAVFRDLDDSKDRITATVDADGNRTAVTLDLT